MLLRELLNSEGTYVAVKLTYAATVLLQQWAVENNLEPLDDYHTTILYSRNYVPVVVEADKLHFATPTEFEMFDGGCLVLKLDAPTLTVRNEQLMLMGGTSDYDTYQPHITLATNIQMPENLKLPNFSIVLGDEYTEAIDISK